MWIVEIGNFLINASVKVAMLIFISSFIFLLPASWVSGILSWVSWVSDLGPGFEYHHQATQNAYGTQIFISFIISLVIIFSHCVSWLYEKWRNRGRKLQILKEMWI